MVSFSEETRVEHGEGGDADRFVAHFSEEWSGPNGPQGGVVAATTVRAMGAALGEPAPRLRTSTTVFVSRIAPGAVDVDVEVLRAGRSVTQVQGTVTNAGASGVGHRTLAVFGHERDGFDGTPFDFTELAFPDVPSPEACRPLPDDRPPSLFDWSFWSRVETCDVAYHYPWETDWEGGAARGVRWIRYRDTPRLADGSLDPLAYLPVVDVIPGSVGQRLGPRPAQPYFAPSLDLTVHFLDSTDEEWMLQVMQMRRAVHGYGSGEMQLWSRDGRLLAHASQTMVFRLADPV